MREQLLSFTLMYLKDKLEAISMSTGKNLTLIVPEDQFLDLRAKWDQFCIVVLCLEDLVLQKGESSQSETG